MTLALPGDVGFFSARSVFAPCGAAQPTRQMCPLRVRIRSARPRCPARDGNAAMRNTYSDAEASRERFVGDHGVDET